MSRYWKEMIFDLVETDSASDAYLSCELRGTTYASCHASKTISAEGTLAPRDLNWMRIPVIPAPTDFPEPPSSGLSQPTVDGHVPWVLQLLYATSFFSMYIFVLYILEKRC